MNNQSISLEENFTVKFEKKRLIYYYLIMKVKIISRKILSIFSLKFTTKLLNWTCGFQTTHNHFLFFGILLLKIKGLLWIYQKPDKIIYLKLKAAFKEVLWILTESIFGQISDLANDIFYRIHYLTNRRMTSPHSQFDESLILTSL